MAQGADDTAEGDAGPDGGSRFSPFAPIDRDALRHLSLCCLLCLVATAGPAAFLGTATGGADPTAQFSPNVVTVDQGGVLNVTAHASEPATINLGGPEVGFWMQVEVGSGTTRLELNTYDVDDPRDMISATEGSIHDVTLRTRPPTHPLDPASYPMNVTVDGTERALGVFVVRERHTNGSTGLVIPEDVDVDELDSGADVRNVATELDGDAPVARGDWFVYRINATGLDGFLSKDVLDGSGEGVRVTFRESNGRTNADPNRFAGDEAEHLLIDPERAAVYLFVDTADHGIDPGDEYEVTFTIDESNPLVPETETTNATFAVDERRLTLDGDPNRLRLSNETTLTGNTTLAPGSQISIRVRHSGIPPVLKRKTANVSANRTISAFFDLSDVPRGLILEIGSTDPPLDRTGVKPLPETTTRPTTVANRTTTEILTNRTETTITTTTTTMATETATETATLHPTEKPITAQPVAKSGGQPGLDVRTSLLALAVAALAAVRRRRVGR